MMMKDWPSDNVSKLTEVYQEPVSFEPRDVFGLLEKYKMAPIIRIQKSEESNQRCENVQFSRPSVQLPQD